MPTPSLVVSRCESHLGGYGLYYRSPMIDMGMVVPRGSALGEAITPIDVLDPNGPGPALADAFGSAIPDTSYFREHMLGTSAIPREVLEELGERACLCRLPDFPNEQALLRQALFEPPAPGYAKATKQRCRSFALLLRELEGSQKPLSRTAHLCKPSGTTSSPTRLAMGHCAGPSLNGRRSQNEQQRRALFVVAREVVEILFLHENVGRIRFFSWPV